MYQRRRMEAGDRDDQTRREFAPPIDAMSGRSITCPKLRQRPDTEQIEAAIERVDNSQDNHCAKENVEDVVQRAVSAHSGEWQERMLRLGLPRQCCKIAFVASRPISEVAAYRFRVCSGEASGPNCSGLSVSRFSPKRQRLSVFLPCHPRT